VKLFDLPLFADENIDQEVVAELRNRGHDVLTARESGLAGASDREILEAARSSGRVVMTHDADFGALAIRDGEPLLGVVYLRPGHIASPVIVGMFDTLRDVIVDLRDPFIIVVERRGNEVRIRVRTVE